jgi:hypothetical protein
MCGSSARRKPEARKIRCLLKYTQKAEITSEITSVRQAGQVIHLDQKNWIELARGYYGRAPEFQKIAQEVVEKSEAGLAIFPLSITHFDETVKILNQERRKRLAKYMMLVSQGWTILPAPMIIEPEIEDACHKHLGLPRYDLQKFAIKKGLSHLVGAQSDIEMEVKDSSNLILKERDLEDLKRYLLGKVDSPEMLLWFMERGREKWELMKRQEWEKVTTEKLEQIRLGSQSEIRDNDLRHRVAIVEYFLKVINPKVITYLYSINVDPRVFIDKFLNSLTKDLQFFLSLPTSCCLVELSHYRDMQRGRKISSHDINDIMSLSIAIPYSDVVLTETMWQQAISQTKLDELRPTTILRSAKGLATVFDE